jgi:Asp/Glu/hydantoin racemase
MMKVEQFRGSKLRIWHQSVNELDHLDVYKRSLERHASEVVGDDAEIVVHGLPSGTYGGVPATVALSNAYAYHRLLSPVIERAITAERQGYDAFVIGSFSEPFLREVRSAVDIPVASLVESALLVGCSLGGSIALISNAPAVQWMTKLAVERHKLASRVLEVASIDPAFDEPALAAAYSDPAPVLSAFMTTAERLIADGADVIVPAEGVLAELLVRHGIHRVSGAQVVDVFAVTWAYALMQIRLWSKTPLRVSRSWQYRRDDPAIVELLWKETAR